MDKQDAQDERAPLGLLGILSILFIHVKKAVSEDPRNPCNNLEMRTVSIEVPDSALGVPPRDPDEFVREMRIAAAVKWYELGELSQGRAAEVAGVTRAEFLAALARFKVSAFQYTVDDLDREARA